MFSNNRSIPRPNSVGPPSSVYVASDHDRTFVGELQAVSLLAGPNPEVYR
jgi:hypothetical protein